MGMLSVKTIPASLHTLSAVLSAGGKPSLYLLLFALMLMNAGAPLYAQEATGDVWRDATLYRDEWGVPHIYANSPFALAFVFGYVQAEDHGESMLLVYRLARGTLAAVLGEAWAESDAFSLKMGHARLAAEAYPALDPLTVTLCEGFAMGVNAWLVDHAHEIPSWADGVQPEDILALWHAFIMSQAPFDLPDLFRREPALASANAWATAPERSDSGAAVLVMNPHQHHDGFFQWYEAHLVLGGMNLYGATLRGLPVILQGHNQRLGWALSPNMPDFADMYREEGAEPAPRNPKDPRIRQDAAVGEFVGETALLLEYMSQASTYFVRTDAGMESRVVPSYIGERGPLFDDPTRGLHSWLIGGYRDFNGFRQLMDMGFATNLPEFQSALAWQQLPCFHIVYADQDGELFYLYNTRTGTRIQEEILTPTGQEPGTGIRWYEPQSFKFAPIAWRYIIPPAHLPYVMNPPSGYLQACGTPPWAVTHETPLNPEQWPAWLVADPDSYRAKRIRQLLHSGIRSFRDHQSMLFDVVVSAAFDTIPALLRCLENQPELVSQAHPDFHEGVELLRQWNCIAESASPGMTFYHLWWTFVKTRAQARYATEPALYQGLMNNEPPLQEIMIRAVEDAARTLRNEYGSLQKNWGDLHRIRRGKREAAFPGALSGEPLFVAGDTLYEQGRWLSTYGYGFAMAVEFGEETRSVSLQPFGTSQNPASPHYDDQLELLLQRRFKRTRFSHDDILRHAEQALGKSITLLPLGVPGAITLHSDNILAARLNSSVEIAEALPPGLAPFSLYMQAERKPLTAPVSVEISLHIPETLCDHEGFQSLALYRYEPGLDWQAMDWQTADPQGRILYGRDPVLAQWYAVLGPQGLVKDTRDVEAPAPLIPERSESSLEKLLHGHHTQPAIGGEGVTFVPDPADMTGAIIPVASVEGEETEAVEPWEESMEEESYELQPGRTFRLEKLDDADALSDRPKALQGIPGYHFGPKSRKKEAVEREEPTVAKDEKKREGEQEEEEKDEPGESIVTPPTPEPVKAPEKPKRERPPLPDVIPQDPDFLFGPAAGDSRTRTSQPDGNRTFRLDRLD
ncbi:MAG: penicillin acylase family protein [Candidatus Hydrogenedens sp.]|jgi:acyl-homoserine lactone acylase PvdQ|nr:penicillin acylase family protein [Candidatus Hydrogenedens sp.]